jgi:hypothetical protein
MQIQRKVNIETIEGHITENQNTQKSDSQTRQRDVFESRIEVQKESSFFEKTKAQNDYYAGNVEGSVNTKDVDQVAEDQKQQYEDAKADFKNAIQMMQEYLERQKAALSKIRS